MMTALQQRATYWTFLGKESLAPWGLFGLNDFWVTAGCSVSLTWSLSPFYFLMRREEEKSGTAAAAPLYFRVNTQYLADTMRFVSFILQNSLAKAKATLPHCVNLQNADLDIKEPVIQADTSQDKKKTKKARGGNVTYPWPHTLSGAFVGRKHSHTSQICSWLWHPPDFAPHPTLLEEQACSTCAVVLQARTWIPTHNSGLVYTASSPVPELLESAAVHRCMNKWGEDTAMCLHSLQSRENFRW